MAILYCQIFGLECLYVLSALENYRTDEHKICMLSDVLVQSRDVKVSTLETKILVNFGVGLDHVALLS